MKKFAILFCVMLITVSSTFCAKTDFMVNLASAKHKAAIEGKLYMVHFTANWCTPCKWMNSHTFTDDRVAQYLSDYYVPVKVNVDDFDGIVIKQKNNVQFLPTLLIFNSKGEEVGRFEEAIGPSKLMLILEENNIPTNREKIDLPEPMEAESPQAISRPILPSIFDGSQNQNTTALQQNDDAPSLDAETVERPRVVYSPPVSAAVLEEPVAELPKVEEAKQEEILPNEPTIEAPATPAIVSSPDLENYTAQAVTTDVNSISTTYTNSTAAESLAFLTGEGIFELDVNFKQKEGYSVQIGLYARYENVLAEVNKFKSISDEKIYVHIGKKNGATIYRLLMGSFDKKSTADKFEYELKDKGLDCFVNDLSKF